MTTYTLSVVDTHWAEDYFTTSDAMDALGAKMKGITLYLKGKDIKYTMQQFFSIQNMLRVNGLHKESVVYALNITFN